jgi:hypothetical protein
MNNTKISIINFPNPQAIEEIAQWDTLFTLCDPIDNFCFNAPRIEEHPLPIGVSALQAVMSAAHKKFDSIWDAFTKEELIEGAQKYWANLDEPGVFDMQKTVLTTAMSFCFKRPLTRCELILAMKCEFLSKFRLQAIANNFDSSKPICSEPDGCINKCTNCICCKMPLK